MNMNFDLAGKTIGAGTNTAYTLEGGKIHDVTFEGVEYSKSKDEKWEFMNIKFKGVEGGYYTDRVFGLKDDANVRKSTQYGENPSQFEMLMLKVKHVIAALSDDMIKQIEDKTLVPQGKNFEQFTAWVSTTLKPLIGTPTKIKLVLSNKGEATFPPFFASVSKTGVAYINTNFIGKNLSFLTKELDSIKKIQTATPTTMPKIDPMSLDDPNDAPAGQDMTGPTNDGDLNLEL